MNQMKLLNLEIKYVRGLPGFQFAPNGNSLVIYGPNGSGKSAVIDSLDFLLTGKIARLSGEGTEGVTLKKHGAHIDMTADLSKVEVKANIQVPNVTEPVTLERKMIEPNVLHYDSKYKTQLQPIIELLNRGQYVFTRREVLKLITARSSTRAQEIQKVLKLNEIEDIRLNLVKIRNDTKRDYYNAKITLEKGKRDVISITGQTNYDEAKVLVFVNNQRTKLGGEEIEELVSEKLQEGIMGVQVNPNSINHQEFSKRINNLKPDRLSEISDGIVNINKTLKSTIKQIHSDPETAWNSKRFSFTKEGMKLLRDSGECPLCDNEWPNEELRKYLQKRIEIINERQKEVIDNSQELSEKFKKIKTRIQHVTEILHPLSNAECIKENELYNNGLNTLGIWDNKIASLLTALIDPVEKYQEDIFSEEEIESLFAPDDLISFLNGFEKEIKKLFPEATPEQVAWDTLTKLVERIKVIEESYSEFKQAESIFVRASSLEEKYIEARDEILEGLYNKIRKRFVNFYKEMHGDDEKDFDASFTPGDAGIDFTVDFYGRGLHPPHALHSEGHQDSMGVCLFLALSEHLNSGLIDLVILDDVVMSVDIGHRRAFCSLLANNFPEKQFIITTHDTTWANQLRGDGLVNRKQMLKFSNWTVDHGPIIQYEADVWSKIEDDLDKDDVLSASAKLRNYLEEFTRFVCHNLRAKVPYTLDDCGNLGDFLPAAIGRYKELIKKAKEVANSWNQKDSVRELSDIDDRAKLIIKDALGEQWTINKAIHFNDWAKFSKEDFQPVVNAFRKLCDSVFSCENDGCEAVLKVVMEGSNENGVKCNCGAMNWNLVKKE